MACAAQCVHPHMEEDESEGCLVCVACGATQPMLSAQNVEWRHGISDGRVRADMQHSDDEGHDNEDQLVTRVAGCGELSKLQRGLVNSNYKRIYLEAKDYIAMVCVNMSIDEGVAQEAIRLLRMLRDFHTRWRGTRKVGLLISCISIACQRNGVGISDAAILACPIVRQPTRVLNRQKKLVLQALYEKNIVISVQTDAAEFTFRTCSMMGYDRGFSCRVSRMAVRIPRSSHMQSKPCVMIVATSILRVSERRRVAVDIGAMCKICGVTRPTLCKWYSECTGMSIVECRNVFCRMDTPLSEGYEPK